MGVLVVIKQEQDRGEWIAALDASGLTWADFESLPCIFRIEGTTPADFPLKDHPGIESIEPDDLTGKPAEQAITIDVMLDQGSWALPRIIRRRAPWNVDRLQHPIDTYFRCNRDGTGVDVYVMDTGIDTARPCFGGRATNIYEFFSSGGKGDDVGHGTAVASCAVGDEVGIARGALVWGLKIGQAPNGNSAPSALIAAIGQMLTHYNGRAGTNRPAVCNVSFSFATSTAVLNAIAGAIDAGIVMVGSAGNDAVNLSTGDVLPAMAPDAVCVGGSGMADLPYYAYNVGFSGLPTYGTNYGIAVDILAPSQRVRQAAASVMGVGSWRTGTGTSYGSPLTAGVIACMLQGNPRLTSRAKVQAVKAKLTSNATSGKLRSDFGLSPLPDRILYLDPNQAAPEPIPGLQNVEA
ncbi:subtilisin family serine protease [Mesorhizobium soli]|uniref:S8 family serine peptidase n=1 Tax=Pseudaminobacter soli (ex Li et al. 2025) TaxID=1295366 RepID=UPI0024742192|nr:S8 family serine peptidase [Mesorhizobium soli]MDH6235150.1 subtilisin family serine protease [Mesorhizobium soli]